VGRVAEGTSWNAARWQEITDSLRCKLRPSGSLLVSRLLVHGCGARSANARVGGGNAPQGGMEVVLVPLLEKDPPLTPDPALTPAPVLDRDAVLDP